MINYQYNLRLDLNNNISMCVDEINDNDFDSIELKFSMKFSLIAISCFVKTEFNRIDQQFKDFGVKFLEFLKKDLDLEIYERIFIHQALSDLILNNIQFSKSLFPREKEIEMIKSPLQVELLLSGGYFILLPEILVKCSDIHFKFKLD
jgi:hypothetical protein